MNAIRLAHAALTAVSDVYALFNLYVCSPLDSRRCSCLVWILHSRNWLWDGTEIDRTKWIQLRHTIHFFFQFQLNTNSSYSIMVARWYIMCLPKLRAEEKKIEYWPTQSNRSCFYLDYDFFLWRNYKTSENETNRSCVNVRAMVTFHVWRYGLDLMCGIAD